MDVQSPSVTKINTKTGYDEETDRTTNAPPWRYKITFSSFRALSCAGDHSVPSFKIQYAGIAMDSTPAFAAYSPTIPTISPLQLRYPHKPRIVRFQLLLRNFQREVTAGEDPDLEGQQCEFPDYPCHDRAAESPSLSGPVGSPGVVDQPVRDLDED